LGSSLTPQIHFQTATQVLFQYFTACALTESGRPSKECRKFKGLANKLQQWRFVSEAAMLEDALRCLKQLSLYLQGSETNVINALHHVNDIKDELLALKERDCETLAKVTKNYVEDGFFNVPLKRTELDETTCSKFKMPV
jgi:hypothetical protein